MAAHKSSAQFFFCIAQAVFGDIEAYNFDSGDGLGQFVKQIGLAAADIQNSLTGLDSVMGGQFVRQRAPAAVVAIAAIAESPVAVPVIEAELPGDRRAIRLVVLEHALNVVAADRAVLRLDKVNARHQPASGRGAEFRASA